VTARAKKKPAQRRAVKAVATPAGETVLVMRTCDADMLAHGGSREDGREPFRWPTSGPVEAPDWKPTKRCGNGLHGLLWGVGSAGLLDWSESAKWLVVEVAAKDIVDLDGKVKFPRGTVIYVGDSKGAAALIATRAPAGSPIIRGTATAGDSGTATAGYSGTATAGDSGTATAGDRGTATAGDSGTATAGDRGTATAGDRGTATAGDRGTATAGYSGKARSGDMGAIVVRWWDYSKSPPRERITVGYVGEDGVKPNTFYRCDEAGKLVEVAS